MHEACHERGKHTVSKNFSRVLSAPTCSSCKSGPGWNGNEEQWRETKSCFLLQQLIKNPNLTDWWLLVFLVIGRISDRNRTTLSYISIYRLLQDRSFKGSGFAVNLKRWSLRMIRCGIQGCFMGKFLQFSIQPSVKTSSLMGYFFVCGHNDL